ncbi:phage tail spike protein [Paenibacillus sp. GCM10012306]|uniref:phage tail spike protein n=1 Tax=Paenibacillus sp. GCM10012306 TaxID=3317342 RepID=UPI0036D371AC
MIEQINTEIIKPKLFLCRPDKKTIARLPEVHNNITQKIYNGSLNELSFKIPLMLTELDGLVKNKHIDLLKEHYLIRFEKGNYKEYYVIDKIPKASNEDDSVTVECLSYGYSLASKLIKNYNVESYTLSQILSDLLKQTVWKIGYVDASFDLKYRAISFTGNVLEGIQQAADKFNALIVWDTINQKIHFYNPNNYGKNKGFTTKFGMLMQSLNHELNFDEFCTRLKLFGKEGISIQSVNPLGTNFIQDFSYFIYPYQKDNSGKLIKHSDYMSDDLCEALINYSTLYAAKQNEYTGLLNQMTSSRAILDTKETELSQLKTQLYIIDDNLATANATGGDTTQIKINKTNMETQIKNKDNEISATKAQIISIQSSMDILSNSLKMENNLTDKQLTELNPFIIEKEFSDDNYSDAKTLLADGKIEFDKIREPKIVAKVSLVNFYEIMTESHNWEKLNIADIVTVKHERLGIGIQANVSQIDFDYENSTIDVTVSNARDLLTDEQRFMKNYYKSISSSNTVDIKSKSWDRAKATADETTKLLNETWDAVKHDIVAGVNESVEISRKGIIIRDPNDPQKLLVMQHGQIALSQDNGNTWSTAILPDRIVAERIAGRLIMGNKLSISDDAGTFTVEGNLLTIKDPAGNIRVQLGGYNPGMYGLKIVSRQGDIVLNEDGIVQTDSIQLADNVDSTHGLKLKFYIDDGMISIRKVVLNFSLERFRAYSKGASAGGGSITTTQNGNGYSIDGNGAIVQNGHLVAGGMIVSGFSVSGMAQPSGGGTYYTSSEGSHNHGGSAGSHNHGNSANLNYAPPISSDGSHSHQTTIPPHSHDVLSHSHFIDHTHTISIPAHSHDINYGIYESSFASGVNIFIDGVHRSGAYYGSENSVDVTQWITTKGWHTIELTSTQLGRINAGLYLKTFVGF